MKSKEGYSRFFLKLMTRATVTAKMTREMTRQAEPPISSIFNSHALKASCAFGSMPLFYPPAHEKAPRHGLGDSDRVLDKWESYGAPCREYSCPSIFTVSSDHSPE
jgi:hypothetical protein